MNMEAPQDTTAASTLRLVEEGCLEVYTQSGDCVRLRTLRDLYAAYGKLPADLLVRVTDKGRDALARGRP